MNNTSILLIFPVFAELFFNSSFEFGINLPNLSEPTFPIRKKTFF